ncbi:ADP-ribose glycohydrolase OARD1 isoform X1 [Trichomycterus rosablanca]|uniref:ADP-ribose glycohydrolase OARD1 isoform X1 n=1 Tax=Trichomycterus rosablanca TaxID=2290929 RepID=UPI002F35DEC8
MVLCRPLKFLHTKLFKPCLWASLCAKRHSHGGKEKHSRLTARRPWVRFPGGAVRVLSVWSLHVLPVSAWVSSHSPKTCFQVENKLCYKEGDLFSCPDTDALAHCISMDCKMGAGIAKIFKKKFKGVEELLEQKKEPGQCAVLKRDDRFVYYLVTKEKYNHKPTYRTLKQSLEAMKDHCVKNGVSRLSIPRIGCGLDKLCWNKVSLMIQDVFQNTDVVITVYLLKTTETTRRNK